MTLTGELGYQPRGANGFQVAMQRLGGTRPGAWFFSKTLRHLDRATTWVTRGRTAAPTVLAGLPVITVTSTGARTGRLRASPLIGVPTDGELAVVGTNFGQAPTPGWYHNLRAHPTAEVTYRGRTAVATAREAEGDERAAILDRAEGMYGGFGDYQERIEDRRVHVMVLEVGPGPAGEESPPRTGPDQSPR